jgi:hypothetical protein
MTKLTAILVASLMATSSALADDWDINQNFVKIGIIEAAWTIDPNKFEGTKALVDAHFTINRKMIEPKQTEGCCPPKPPAERLIGVLDGDFQFGDSDTDLEYVVVAATPLAYQRNTDLKAKKFMIVRETLEWGQLLYSRDDPLGIDYYVEFTAAKAGPTWAYKHSEKSPWSIIFGVKASLGWAWASSVNPIYKNVSNGIMGLFNQVALAHETWGRLYFHQRLVNGWSISNPMASSSGSISREAQIRGGYSKIFKSGFTIDLIAEKRSFYFSDPVIPSQYTQGRRLGVEIGYQF